MNNKTNEIWQDKVAHCVLNYDYESKPRGMAVREILAGQYTVPMPAYLNLSERNVNLPFMFAEAAWILRGSNRLEDLTRYMKVYERYSDDNVFLKGAYGPKIVDQLPYIIKAIAEDLDTRQAVLNIWRERPDSSKDVPCTTNMQFIVRDGKLNNIVTMRSHDIVLGFTYDVFTFSMVAKAVQLLLKETSNINVELGNLHVTAGSMHIYENFYEKGAKWLDSKEEDETITSYVEQLAGIATYNALTKELDYLAETTKERKN